MVTVPRKPVEISWSKLWQFMFSSGVAFFICDLIVQTVDS